MNRRMKICKGMFRASIAVVLTLAVFPAASNEAPTSRSSELRSSVGPMLPFPTGDVRTINVIEWDANALPRIYERSDQLPLTDEDVLRLVEAEMPAEMIVKMIEERRCACDASAEGLINLRQAGMETPIIAAISTHSLRPNRHLNLTITLDFDGDSRVSRERFLYLFIEDGDLTRVFSADLGALLATERTHESMVDQSDLLISRAIRRIQLAGEVPLKTYGSRHVMVVTSANPALSHPSQLTKREIEEAQTYTIDYPRSSISNICRLHVGYRRDVMLAHRWHFAGSRFECEWN